MNILGNHIGLYTDFYELTMAQGHYVAGHKDDRACFEYYFRENPFNGGYVIFAGLWDLIEILKNYKFSEEAISYLRTKGFQAEFLKYLRDFRFQGHIVSMREGEVVFPNEPILRVEGSIIEVQIIETVVLNILNYSSLIATKASRISHAAHGRKIIDFGLRRAPALGSIHGTKAAFIGGVESTSNVFAAQLFDLDVTGTQAHSWVQCFESEIESFRKFADIYPDNCVLLVDTYDTLASGLPNAVTVAKEMEAKGHKLRGIRIDSGDLEYFSKKARSVLDQAGLNYVKIIASNMIDEYVIRSLLEQDAPIDVFGVGTRLITGGESSSLDGVYKMSLFKGTPRFKISDNKSKMTLPGKKKTVRYVSDDGHFLADGVLLDTEISTPEIFHPLYIEKHTRVDHYKQIDLFVDVMKNGNPIGVSSLKDSVRYARERVEQLPKEHRRFENPHTYKVGISSSLMKLRDEFVRDVSSAYHD